MFALDVGQQVAPTQRREINQRDGYKHVAPPEQKHNSSGAKLANKQRTKIKELSTKYKEQVLRSL